MQSCLFGAWVHEGSGWSYIQTTQQGFSFIIEPQILSESGSSLDPFGDGSAPNDCLDDQDYGSDLSEQECADLGGVWHGEPGSDVATSCGDGIPDSYCCANPDECDVIGAFIIHETKSDGTEWEYHECVQLGDGATPIALNLTYPADNDNYDIDCEICVGWVYFDSGHEADDDLTTTVPMMGSDDIGDNELPPYYCEIDDAVNLKFYDTSSSLVYNLSNPIDIEWGGNNGFIDIVNETFYTSASCTAQEYTCPSGDCASFADGCTYGCMDENSCDYDQGAMADDGSCEEYPEENFDCDGNCVVDIDCNDVCGGAAVEDDCGVCDGGNVDDLGCGCFELGPSGCDNECGSDLEVDECGECGGDGIDDGACDCDGNVLDECDICGGDGPDSGVDCDGNPLSNSEVLPEAFEFISIYPNPFNPSTQIIYSLNKPQDVNIKVLNSSGHQIEVLANNLEGIGRHQVQWTPKSNLASGSYFIVIGGVDDSIIKKVTYIK